MRYADVILPVPLQGLFTYAIPDGMAVGVGMRVLVTFGRSKTYIGIVDRVHDMKPDGYEVKPIQTVMDSQPLVTDTQLRLWHWIADYYLSPIGEVYKAALPSGLKSEDGYRPKTETYVRLTEAYRSATALHIALNVLSRAKKQLDAFIGYLELSGWDRVEDQAPSNLPPQEEAVTREELMNVTGASADTLKQLEKRQLLETYEVEVGRLNHGGAYRPELIKTLSGPQQEAYNHILMQFLKRHVVLLHGVTSSGKTEIYIQLIQQALERKEQVLFLMPEIALTVQMMQRLQRVFGDRLGIYHSKYSDAERVEIWQKQLSQNPYDVILGARSAVLLPFQRLGLIIVDEEHETSYKQQDPAPRYHARSAAIVLAQMCGAKTLLGTATPSLESYYNARTGKYGLVELKQRYQGIELPEIQVVDTADLQRRKMMAGPFSPLLLTRVREALEHGEQAILFQNRRGFAPMIECRQCGWVPRCQHCDVSLTLHRQMQQLTCHYCGFTYRVPTECPCCGSTDLRTRGYGTEKIEEQVREVFPEARIARMDLDTTRTRNAYERIINDFSAGRTNILIGTQMISKGLDFDRVSVVGILGCDSMLNFPDFRAYEHAFMMMSQVSGRAGRKNRRGLVVLQTKSPQLSVVQQVVRNDYAALYSDQIAERQAFRYPPYYRLVYVFLKHRQDAVVQTAAIEMGARLRQLFADRVLGPDKPAVAKVKQQNIRKLVLKLELGIDMKRVRQCLLGVQQQMSADKRYSSLQIYYDVDPI
ncbi:MAG: primosomal protein N' [Prevotella sp.]|nr:primosomal protein N' [Prevotella sp.]